MKISPGPQATLAALSQVRPELVDAYAAALPAARAAVLARLWGGLAREPVPGIVARDTANGRLCCRLTDGRELTGPAAAAAPFAVVDNLTMTLDGHDYTDPAPLVRAVGLAGHLASELDNSVANLALARAAQPAPHGGRPMLSTDTDPADLEQLIVDGHPLHPCCRTRLGMSTEDVLAYAPEHRPAVGVELVPVSPVLVTGAWPDWLRDGSDVLLPVHPWQRHRYDLPAGRATLPTRPLMSLRTLAVGGRPWHLKTAVDVQMTSAVRVVSPAAVHNGPALSALLSGLAIGGIEVLPETAAAAALVDGEPSRSLAAAVRRAPAVPAVPFAALSAPSPATGRALLTEAVALAGTTPGRFLAQVVAVALPPLFTLLDLGVALEAHGQNTLLVIDRGRPVRLLYRDLGGVRISPARLRTHGIEPPPIRGDLVSDDPVTLRTKLLAALSTVLGELVATAGREYGEPPEALWSHVAAAVRVGGAGLPAGARRMLHSLLTGPWPTKATTAMRLATDPLQDVWTELPNPLEAL